MPPSSSTSRWLRRLFLLGLLLLVLGLGLKAWRIAQAARSLLASQAEAEALLADGLLTADPAATRDLLHGIRQDVVTLRTETAVFLPLTPYLGWLPEIGPLVVAAPPLLEMADAGTAAAVSAYDGLAPALVTLQDPALAGQARIAALLQTLDAAAPRLAQAAADFDRLVAARSRLGDTSAFPAQLQALLRQADPWLPVAQDGLRVAQVLPALMGLDGPRRYLILAQNENEVRPTGGFLAGAGLLTVANGTISDVSFLDANQVDAWDAGYQGLLKPYADPPEPLQTFMGLELFLFRDANFWPDFPTSAGMAMDLYSYGQDAPPLDGAIAIDQQFLRLLVQVVGAVEIPEEAVTITAANVISAMQAAWGRDDDQTRSEWIFDRKSFLGYFASAILSQLLDNFASIDPLYLVDTMIQAIDERHLQLTMRDPAVEAALDAAGWNGRLHNRPNQDVLMVVDTNVGYNKVNLYVERQTAYRVDLGSGQAETAVTYRHTGADPGEPCFQGTPYTADVTYLGRAETCYWNYLRIYTPAGSSLQDATRHVLPGDTLFLGETIDRPAQTLTDDPTGLTVFANQFLLPWAQTLTSQYRYALPPVTQPGADGAQVYRLTVYKQAGTAPEPLQVAVQLPPGAQFVSAAPAPTTAADGLLQFALTLDGNLLLEVVYR
ncbi:MAG: DUF4012 domain-containing protein [Anaerolineales bacterium]|nr:DUF4012 domain-containing protein [Anaerolineales bacterium]